MKRRPRTDPRAIKKGGFGLPFSWILVRYLMPYFVQTSMHEPGAVETTQHFGTMVKPTDALGSCLLVRHSELSRPIDSSKRPSDPPRMLKRSWAQRLALATMIGARFLMDSESLAEGQGCGKAQVAWPKTGASLKSCAFKAEGEKASRETASKKAARRIRKSSESKKR